MAIMAISWLYHGYIMAISWLYHYLLKRSEHLPSGVSHKKHLRILIEELRSTDSQPGESAGRVPTMRLGFNGFTMFYHQT